LIFPARISPELNPNDYKIYRVVGKNRQSALSNIEEIKKQLVDICQIISTEFE